MRTPHIFSSLALFAFTASVSAQTPPTAYTIAQAVVGGLPGSTIVTYRSGSKALTDTFLPANGATPASHTLTLFDLAGNKSWSWNPADKNVPCSANNFSGDWGGDPFQPAAEISAAIAKGELKPAGSETVVGISTKIYTGTTEGMNVKAWFDEKDGLVVKMALGASGAAMSNMVNITRAAFTAPAPSLFVLPSICAGVKPPPTAAELIAAETGDNPDNFVNANYGPGSKASCSILIRVVTPKTMAPVMRRWQAAIDTTYDQNNPNPPHYTFGVGNDGTATFSGGGLHEISSQVHNDMLRIDHVPPYFNFAINVVQPGYGAGTGLIYRQCFAPVTMLYFILKDPANPGAGGDYLYAKAGKYAAVPTQ